MTDTSSTTQFNKVRRADREIQDETWIKAYLATAPFGIFSTSIENQPFLHPNLFVYDVKTSAIYFHMSEMGQTFSNILDNARISFVVCEMNRLLPAKTAREFSVEYQSVIVNGYASILKNLTECIYGLQLLMDKYFPQYQPGRDYPALDEAGMTGTAVCKLSIQSWSAKKKSVPEEFPGAFKYTR